MGESAHTCEFAQRMVRFRSGMIAVHAVEDY
jgi:hypothetical protein